MFPVSSEVFCPFIKKFPDDGEKIENPVVKTTCDYPVPFGERCRNQRSGAGKAPHDVVRAKASFPR